ncbi:hypothetical protein M8J75_006443 [Diaphorina citri]|nr:hypothetical protein M8J75_006443 [Diaphorina citri]
MLTHQCSALVILLLCTSASMVTAQSPSHLCDECECLPTRETPETVNCMCNKKKILIFQDHYIDSMLNTTHLNISSCTFLSLPMSGFGRASHLHYVEIKNLTLFHLVPNVFPHLRRLYIDNVKELILNTFAGLPRFESLIILRSKLNELSADSFQAISSMREIVLNQVYIGKIWGRGVDADFGEEEGIGSSFTIQSSKISEIDTNGLALSNLRLFQIINSTLETIRPHGLNVSATSINLISNRFGTLLSNQSFLFQSNNVQITFNEFYYLPDNLLNTIVTDRISFLSNIIFDVDLGAFLLNLDLTTVSFLKLNYNFPGIQITNETEIIVDNYCLSYDQISLFTFKEHLINGTMCAGEVPYLNTTLPDETTLANDLQNDLESSSSRVNMTRGGFSSGGSTLEVTLFSWALAVYVLVRIL